MSNAVVPIPIRTRRAQRSQTFSVITDAHWKRALALSRSSPNRVRQQISAAISLRKTTNTTLAS